MSEARSQKSEVGTPANLQSTVCNLESEMSGGF
jgi:hypothetical protein